MNKHFLLIFSCSCYFMVVTTLRCMTCYLRTPMDHCRRGFGFCIAEKEETCMMLTIYKENSPELYYTDCQKFCRDVSYQYNNRTYVHSCCNFDYCNFKF